MATQTEWSNTEGETNGNVSTTRQLPCWITAFTDASAQKSTPEIFRKWSALATIAGALERRCWTYLDDDPIYANQFIVLVSPPGIGKSRAIGFAAEVANKTGQFNIAPDSITRAGLIDELVEAQKAIHPPKGVPYVTHPLLCFSSEFGVLVPANDLEFLNTLNDLYDNRRVFVSRTRGGGTISIDRPSLNLVAGTQPKFLSSIMPEAAWSMGYTSRTIFVYAGHGPKRQMFKKKVEDKQLLTALERDLRCIAKLNGEYTWTEEAMNEIEEWYDAGEPPVPTHHRLQHYCSRRLLHTVKLSMAVAAARHNEMEIRKEDFLYAKETLIEAEHLMPEIFKEMASTTHLDIINETYTFALSSYAKKRQPITEGALWHFLQARIPVTQIPFVVESMLRSGMLRQEEQGQATSRRKVFTPASRTELED